MDPPVLAAVVTGACGLAVSVYNTVSSARRERMLRRLGFRYDTALEEWKSKLAREEAATRARTEYEYAARMRLYERFEPLLFQLRDHAEYALDRIQNLTDPAVWPKLELIKAEAGLATRGRPPLAASHYEMVATLY